MQRNRKYKRPRAGTSLAVRGEQGVQVARAKHTRAENRGLKSHVGTQVTCRVSETRPHSLIVMVLQGCRPSSRDLRLSEKTVGACDKGIHGSEDDRGCVDDVVKVFTGKEPGGWFHPKVASMWLPWTGP